MTNIKDVGDILKEDGMATAAANKANVLQMARSVAVEIAERIPQNLCHDGIVLEQMEKRGRPNLGNAAGSIFRSDEWKFSGQWVKNKRKSAHSRFVRVWQYTGKK